VQREEEGREYIIEREREGVGGMEKLVLALGERPSTEGKVVGVGVGVDEM